MARPERRRMALRQRDGSSSGTTSYPVFFKDGVVRGSPLSRRDELMSMTLR